MGSPKHLFFVALILLLELDLVPAPVPRCSPFIIINKLAEYSNVLSDSNPYFPVPPCEYGGWQQALRAGDFESALIFARPDLVPRHNFYEFIWLLKTGGPRIMRILRGEEKFISDMNILNEGYKHYTPYVRTNQIGTKFHRNPKVINDKKLYKRVVGRRIKSLIANGPDRTPTNPVRRRRPRPRPGSSGHFKRPSRQVDPNDSPTTTSNLALPYVYDSKGLATPPPSGGATFNFFPKRSEEHRRDYTSGFLPASPYFKENSEQPNQFQSFEDEGNQFKVVQYSANQQPTANRLFNNDQFDSHPPLVNRFSPFRYSSTKSPSFNSLSPSPSFSQNNLISAPSSSSSKSPTSSLLATDQLYPISNRLSHPSPQYQLLVKQQLPDEPNKSSQEVVFKNGQTAGVVGSSIHFGLTSFDEDTVYGKRLVAESRSGIEEEPSRLFPSFILNPRAASSDFYNRVTRTVPKEGVQTRIINNKPIRQWQWPDY